MMQEPQQANIKQHGSPESPKPNQILFQAEVTDSHRDKNEWENDGAQPESVGHRVMQELTDKTGRQPCIRGQQK